MYFNSQLCVHAHFPAFIKKGWGTFSLPAVFAIFDKVFPHLGWPGTGCCASEVHPRLIKISIRGPECGTFHVVLTRPCTVCPGPWHDSSHDSWPAWSQHILPEKKGQILLTRLVHLMWLSSVSLLQWRPLQTGHFPSFQVWGCVISWGQRCHLHCRR